MSNGMNYKYSLLGRFISLIFLIFFTIAFCVTWKIDDIRQKMMDERLSGIAYSVAQDISEDFHHLEDKMHFLATQIASDHLSMDYQSISALLQLFSADPKTRMIHWLPIEWANENHAIIIDNNGILKPPIDIKYRSYINELIKKPFNLYFSTKDMSDFIPAAMGVKRNNSKYLGSLTTGIHLKELEKKINSYVSTQGKEIYYAIIDENNKKAIIQSPGFDINNNPEMLKDINKFIADQKADVSYITKNKSYSMSKIINFPFLVVAGTNPSAASYEEYFYSILPYKFELLFLLAAICGFIYLFYNSILDPFLSLSKAALNISNGEIDTVIPEINNKEGALVAAALEKIKTSLKIEKNLVQEITQTRNALSLTNLRLENKVAERTKALEVSLLEKTSFLNNLSHEIKTPLQGITSIIENLASYWTELNEEKKFQFVRQVSHSSQYLLALVGNLLDMAKFSDGKVVLDLKNTDLVALAKEVIEECKILYMYNKQVTISITNDKSVYASIDRNRIKQVLRNLFLNAIKFSDNNGFVSVNIAMAKIFVQDGLRHDGVQISIHDQGIGIPEDELSNIFSPFSQGTNAKSKAVGAGLGLTISREIINAHYGKIWANNNKDGGATFHFTIPITQPIELVNHYPGTINLNPAGYNILMIDDEEVCLNSVEMLLYGTQYNLIKVNSAQFGLEYLKENSQAISVIFIDLMMPDIYGINVITAIKEDPNLNSIPIILQTSSSDENEIVKAFEKGVFSFITKPYQKKKLLEEINKAIQFKNLHKKK